MSSASIAASPGSEWVGGVIEVPVVVQEGAPFQPKTIVWADATTGAVVGTEVCRPDEVETHAAASLLAATRAPKEGRPRVPGRVRVDSSELAAALRGRVGEIEVVVGPVPELAPVEAALKDFLEGEIDDDDATLLGEGITPELVEAFFAAAARLHQLRPWGRLPPDGFLGVQCRALGIEAGALCVVGQMGESFGFVLFRSEADAIAYLDEVDEAADAEEPPGWLPQHIMLDFDDDPPLAILDEIEDHGWPTDDDWVPNVVMVGDVGVMRPLEPSELIAVTAVTRALVTFLEKEPKLERAWRDECEPLTHSIRVDESGTAIDVTLTAPLWLDGTWDDEYDDEHDGEDDESTRAASEDDDPSERAGAYIARLTESGAVAPELMGWADMVTHYAVDYLGGLVHELSPSQLSELLFDVLPRKISCEPKDAPDMIAAVRAMLDDAASRPGAEGDNARQLAAWIPRDASQRLARELADPRNFGMAKSFVMAGKQAGFDMTTEAGMNAFMAMTNGRLPALRRPPPASEKAKQEQAKAKAKTKAKTAAKARKQTKKARKRSKR